MWEMGDFNGDRTVDFADFVILSARYEIPQPQVAPASPGNVDWVMADTEREEEELAETLADIAMDG